MSADQNPWGARWLVRYSALGIRFGQPGRPAVASVAMNPRSLWTPPLWGRGSFVSCTVCTFTLNLQWQQPVLHPGGWVRDPQYMGMSYLGPTKEERLTEKHLQFELQLWRSVSNFDTTPTPTPTPTPTRTQLHQHPTRNRLRSTLPLGVSSGR